jgi:hypothetical protein
MMRVPYRVPFYPNKVGVHQLISWLAGGGHFIQEFHQKLWRNVFAGFPSWVLESTALPAQVDVFL